jgi:hypothetical protein
MKVAERLLRWREENEEGGNSAKPRAGCFSGHQKSLLEQFWDEVEAAHGDGLYPVNPFANEDSQLLHRAVKDGLLQQFVC